MPAGVAMLGQSSPARSWPLWNQWGRTAACMGAIALAMACGVLSAHGYAMRRPQFALDVASLAEIRAQIPWAAGASRESVGHLVRENLRAILAANLADMTAAIADGEPNEATKAKISVLDPQLPQRLRDALQSSPWVADVRSVMVEFPRSVRIDVALSRPQVAVQTGARVVMVDSRGMVLPMVFADADRFLAFNRHLQPPLRLLVNPPSPAPLGQVWDSPAIRAGLAVDACLAPLHAVLPIESIDIANVGGAVDPRQSEIALRAKPFGGPPLTVLWGRDPIGASYGENSVEQKFAHLAVVLRTWPLDEIGVIDVRFHVPHVIAPPRTRRLR